MLKKNSGYMLSSYFRHIQQDVENYLATAQQVTAQQVTAQQASEI